MTSYLKILFASGRITLVQNIYIYDTNAPSYFKIMS